MFSNGLHKFLIYSRTEKRKRKCSKSDGEQQENLLSKAATLKRSGNSENALNILRRVHNIGDQDERQIAAYEIALLLCQIGRGGDSDRYLEELGYRYRLASPIFNFRSLFTDIYNRKTIFPKAVVYDDILPAQLLLALQKAFSHDSPFWSEHSYPTDSFFSYNIDLRRSQSSSTSSSSANCTNIIESLARYLRPLVEKSFPSIFSSTSIASVEWWCHMRDASSGYAHQLHFDLDEDELHVRHQAVLDGSTSNSSDNEEWLHSVHPLVSSVIYLTDGGVVVGDDDQLVGDDENLSSDLSLPPTLVLNQTLEAGSVASEGAFCLPKKNRLLLFDGRLLHGVIPQQLNGNCNHTKTGKAIATKPVPVHRTTLMLGWWGKSYSEKKKPHSSSGAGLMPNMPMPKPLTLLVQTGGTTASTGTATSTKKKSLKPPPLYRDSCRGIDVTWPAALTAPADIISSEERASVRTATPSQHALVPVCGPVWIPVKRSSTPSSKSKQKTEQQGPIPRPPMSAAVASKYKDDDDSTVVTAFDGTISIEELRKLRGETNNNTTSSNNSISRSNETIGTSTDTVNQEHRNRKKSSKRMKKDSSAESTTRGGSNEEDPRTAAAEVEFISAGELQRLRARATSVTSPQDEEEKEEEEEQEEEEEGGGNVVFVGKWFLKSLDDIRNEVLGIPV